MAQAGLQIQLDPKQMYKVCHAACCKKCKLKVRKAALRLIEEQITKEMARRILDE